MHSFHIFSERVHLLQEFLSCPDQDGPCESKFQQSIINGLIGNHRDGNARRGRKPSIADPMREPLHHHSLDIIPNGGRRQCAVCYNANQGDYKRSRINTWCATCGKGLCIGRCFRRFHNLNEE